MTQTTPTNPWTAAISDPKRYGISTLCDARETADALGITFIQALRLIPLTRCIHCIR